MPERKTKIRVTELGYLLAIQAFDQPKELFARGFEIGPPGADTDLAMLEEVALNLAAVQFAVETSRLPFKKRICEACREGMATLAAKGGREVEKWLALREKLYDDAMDPARGPDILGAVGQAYASLFDDAPDAAERGTHSFGRTVKATKHALELYRVIDD